MNRYLLLVLVLIGCRGKSASIPSLDVQEVVCREGVSEDMPACIGELSSHLYAMSDRVVQIVASEELGKTRRLYILFTRTDDERWPRGRDLYIDWLKGPVVDPSLVVTFRAEKTWQFVLRKYPTSRASIDKAGWQPAPIPEPLRSRKLEFDPRDGVLTLGERASAWRCKASYRSFEDDLVTDPIRPETCSSIATSLGRFTKCSSSRGWVFVFRNEWLLGVGLMFDPSIESLLRDVERERRCF